MGGCLFLGLGLKQAPGEYCGKIPPWLRDRRLLRRSPGGFLLFRSHPQVDYQLWKGRLERAADGRGWKEYFQPILTKNSMRAWHASLYCLRILG